MKTFVGWRSGSSDASLTSCLEIANGYHRHGRYLLNYATMIESVGCFLEGGDERTGLYDETGKQPA